MDTGCPWSKDESALIISIDPPKGTNLQSFCEYAEPLKGRVDAILVNDSQDALMRMTPYTACLSLLERGLHPILGVNNRDRNRLAVQGDLLGAWASGIKDIVIDEGKDPSYGDHPLTKPIYDLDQAGMSAMMSQLNMGKDLGGQEIDGKTGFNFAAWVQWPDDDRQLDAEFNKMERLANTGVQAFFISPQFDVKKVKGLIERARPFNKPLIVGTLLLKSVGMARYLNEVPGVSHVPEETIKKMVKAPVRSKAGIEIAAQFIRDMFSVADGAVLIPLGWEKKIPAVLEEIGR